MGAKQMLYEVVNDTKSKAFCGPTAIAALTQQPISKIQKMARRLRPKTFRYIEKANGRGFKKVQYKAPVMGMGNTELLTIMARLKRKPSLARLNESQSLRAFMDDFGNHSGPFIINVTGHYVAVHKGMICDTWTKGKPVPFNEYKGRNGRVKRYWKF